MSLPEGLLAEDPTALPEGLLATDPTALPEGLSAVAPEQLPEGLTLEASTPIVEGIPAPVEEPTTINEPTYLDAVQESMGVGTEDLTTIKGRAVLGVVETLTSMVSNFVGEMGATFAALPDTAVKAIENIGIKDPEVSAAAEYVRLHKQSAEAINNVIGYEPRSSTGITYSEGLGHLFESIREVEDRWGDEDMDGYNNHYLDIKNKIANGEIDPESAMGMLQEAGADILHAAGPALAAIVNVGIEAPLMLAPFVKGPKGKPTKDIPAPDAKFVPDGQLGGRFEMAKDITPVKPVPENPLALPPPRAVEVPTNAEVSTAIVKSGERTSIPKEQAIREAEILNPLTRDLHEMGPAIQNFIKDNPLPKGVTWADEVSKLKAIRSKTKGKQTKAKTEYFKDTYGVIIKDIDTRLDTARLADIMERRSHMVEWIATASVARATARAERNGTPIEEELQNVFAEYIPTDTVQFGKKFEYGPDLRKGEDVIQDLVVTVTSESGKVIKHRRYNDMGKAQQFLAGNLIAGKQVGQLHPLVKYAVDMVGRANTEIALKTENFLFETHDAPTGKFGTGLRFARKGKGKEGAFTALEEINVENFKEIEALRNAAYEYEITNPIREADVSWFADRGVSSRSIRAHEALRVQLERVRTYLNDLIRTHNSGLPHKAIPLAEIQYLPSFLPHVWEGGARVHIYQGNKHISTVAAPSKRQANKIAKEFDKQGYKTSVSIRSTEMSSSEAAMSSFLDALKFLGDDSIAAREVREKYSAMSSTKGYKVHAQKRKNIAGHMGLAEGKKGNREFFKSIKKFIESAVEFGEMMKMRDEINKVLSDTYVRKNYPVAIKQTHNYLFNASGAHGAVTKQLDTAIKAISNEYITGDMVRTGIGKVNLAALYNFLFFGNIRFFMMQGLQAHLVLPAKMVALQTKGVKGDIIAADLKSTKDSVNPSPEAKKVIQFGINQKIINPNFIEQFAGESERYMGWQSGGEVAIDILSGKALAGYLEEMTRMKAMLSFYHFFKSSGMNATEAMEAAGYHTRTYMVEYSTSERPLVFGESGAGTVGKGLGLFQTWQMNYLGQLYEYFREASVKNPKTFAPVAATLMMQLFMGGVQGIIGFAFAQEISEWLQEHGMVDRTIMEVLHSNGVVPDFITYGVPSAATGIDMSTSLSAPSAITESFIAAPGMEWGTELAISASTWMYNSTIGYGAQPGDDMRFWKALAPSSMDGWVELWYTPSLHAPVPNPKKKMYGEYRRTLHDWVPRIAVAARSLEERKARDTLWLIQKVKERESANLDDVIGVIAKAWHLGTMGSKVEVPDELWAKAEELAAKQEIKPSALVRKVKNRIDMMDSDIWEQVTKMGKTPNGRRMLEEFNRLNGSTYGDNFTKD